MRATVWLARVSGLLAAVLVGWAAGAAAGAIAAFVVAVTFLGGRVRGRSLCAWALLFLSRDQPVRFGDLVTVAHEGTSAGVRCSDGVAVVAIQILGKAHQPTKLIGAAPAETANTMDLSWLIPALKQTLGIALDSISVVMSGSRRAAYGDYPRIYDTLIGPSPYAGLRETWLLLRLPDLPNGEALQWRISLGSAAVACAHRTAALLRLRGIRARVATASEISEYEQRMGRDGLEVRNRHWDALRSDTGWLTTYAYGTAELDPEKLGQAWLWRADGVTQNVTLLSDGTATATVTLRSNQRLTSAPSAVLQTMPGEQAHAAALNMCLARRDVKAAVKIPFAESLVLPVGSSGVLLGKYRSGGRMLLPLTDAVEESRVHIAAEDSIAHRFVLRLAGAGERITVHTGDVSRWTRLRMPNLAVTDGMRPHHGTTVSVVDGTMLPAPRPRTVISIGPPGYSAIAADVLLEQVAPQTLRVTAAGVTTEIDIEMFRVERPYLPIGENESN